MKQTPATRRAGEQLKEKLGYILLYEVADPRLDLVNITGVEVSIDHTYARVYVACAADEYDEVMEAFEGAKGRIRSLVARSLDWRQVPELDFRIDRSTDQAERISKALENVPPTIGVEKDEEGYPIVRDPSDGTDDGGEPVPASDAARDADLEADLGSDPDAEGSGLDVKGDDADA